MAVTIRIQHAAGREAPLNRLLGLLPPAVEVITDRGEGPPNPWRGYQRCLSNLPEQGHVCVLQDDTIVCQNFTPALELIAEANPEVPVVLFCGGLPKRTVHKITQALMQNQRYTDLAWHDFMPVVATLWPTHIAASFLQWTSENVRRLPGGPTARSDDAVAGRWSRFARQRIRVAVPSLVQHPDDVPSMISTRAKGGLDKGRVAAYYIGSGNPLDLDWS